MNFELYIDGEKKIFTTPVVPMLAKRKYLEIEARNEKKRKEDKNYIPSPQKQLEEEDEMVGILANVVFDGQFTVDQVYKGASDKYVYDKLREAVFGKPPEENKEDDEGNQKGE